MKQELIDLIDKIQKATGLTQGEISEKAGYKAGYLSEQISKNQVSKKLYEKVRLATAIQVRDAGAVIIENQVEIMATQRVILSVLAEIQAPQAQRLPTELANIYRRMVRDEAEQVQAELRQRG